VSIEELECSNELQTRSALHEQTRRLESKSVMGSDVRIDNGASLLRRTAGGAARFDACIGTICDSA
jgi:hypothetical protein